MGPEESISPELAESLFTYGVHELPMRFPQREEEDVD
jgi:hypothetical protein